MKYVFFGTPEFASIILGKLIEAEMAPDLLVCNPDRPIGRKQVVTSPPTKILAEEHNIPVWQPEKIDLREAKNKFVDARFAIVATYAQIIKPEIIDFFPLGIIGIHYSFLPKYRGPSPVQSAILAGDKMIATTFSLMDEELDHGPILYQKETEIKKNETRTELDNRLAVLSGELLIDILPKFVAGNIVPREQDHTQATYTKKFSTRDSEVDLNHDDPEIVWRKIRALSPDPGVFIYKNGKRIKLLEATFDDEKLHITKIQTEGKTPREISEREQKEILGI